MFTRSARSLRFVVALWASVVTSCTGTTPDDAGVDAGEDPVALECPGEPAVDGVCPPMAPAPPVLPECLSGDAPTGCAALPVFTNWVCPAGWSSVPAFVDENGVEDVPEGMVQHTICAPPALAENCALGEKVSPMTGACVVVGSACPVGEWPENLPSSGAVFYVRAGEVGGDGSLASPFGTIAAALAVAGPGATVALAKGTFSEAIVVDDAVHIRGACARDTVLAAPSASDSIAIARFIDAGGATLENVTMTGPRPGVDVDGAIDPVTIRGVIFSELVRYGIALGLSGGGGEIVDVLIADVDPIGDGSRGRGISLGGEIVVNIENATIDRTHGAGILMFDVGDGSTPHMDIENVLVRRTAIEVSSGFAGIGIAVTGPGSAMVRRAIVDESFTAGIYAYGTEDNANGPSVTIVDAAVSRTAIGSGGAAAGLMFGVGAVVDAERVAFRANENTSVLLSSGVGQAESSLALRDAALLDTNPEDGVDTLAPSVALVAVRHGDLSLDRVLVDRSGGGGVYIGIDEAEGAITTVARDLVVRAARWIPWTGNPGQPDLGAASPLVVVGGSTVLERVLSDGNEGTGLRLGGDGANRGALVASDLTVRDSVGVASSELFDGSGLRIVRGFDGTLERVVVRNNQGFAFAAYAIHDFDDASTLVLRDALILGNDATPELGDSIQPVALAISDDLDATVESTVLLTNTFLGIGITGPTLAKPDAKSPHVILRDVRVGETAVDANGRGGLGLWAVGADLDATRLVFEASRTSAINITGDFTESFAIVSLTDIAIAGVEGNVGDAFGYGVVVDGSAIVTASRVSMTDTQRAGLALVGHEDRAPHVEVEDLLVRVTREAGCGDSSSCVEPHGGTGINTKGPAILTLTRFDVRSSALSGLQLFGDGIDVTATDGMLTDNEFGLTIQSASVDRSQDFTRVKAVDNRSADLTTEAIDIPEGLDLVLDLGGLE